MLPPRRRAIDFCRFRHPPVVVHAVRRQRDSFVRNPQRTHQLLRSRRRHNHLIRHSENHRPGQPLQPLFPRTPVARLQRRRIRTKQKCRVRLLRRASRNPKRFTYIPGKTRDCVELSLANDFLEARIVQSAKTLVARTFVWHFRPFIPVEQRHIPFHFPPKFRVVPRLRAAQTAVRHVQFEPRMLRHSPKNRRRVLHRVRGDCQQPPSSSFTCAFFVHSPFARKSLPAPFLATLFAAVLFTVRKYSGFLNFPACAKLLAVLIPSGPRGLAGLRLTVDFRR